MASPLRRPFIVGIGGTTRASSSTEAALAFALAAAARGGAETRLFGGEYLARLPHYDPNAPATTSEQQELIAAVRRADGVIVATPAYHGGISGVVKNALDTLEMTSKDASPYLDGLPMGAIVTSWGWQGAGTTLTSLRAIAHALRAWPTPFGATLNSAENPFDAEVDNDSKDCRALKTVAQQVLDMARLGLAPRATGGREL